MALFLLIYVTASAVAGDFYKVPESAVFLISVGKGITEMNELIIITLLAGGMLELIHRGGGLDLIIESITNAIITTGGIANDISRRFGISPRKTASILDTFSCFVQGLIPYGTQILMAAGLFGISPASIAPVLSIAFDYPRHQKS